MQVSDWELNFKVLKAAARDAERLPNEVKVRAPAKGAGSGYESGLSGSRVRERAEAVPSSLARMHMHARAHAHAFATRAPAE